MEFQWYFLSINQRLIFPAFILKQHVYLKTKQRTTDFVVTKTQ